MLKAAMIKDFRVFIVLLIVVFSSFKDKPDAVPRPKLVVGIVVDQMRWDYLYRYYERYGSGGFRRLLGEGYSCENTMVNYLPSYTGPGHSCIYTGSVPSIHGITSNNWIDNVTGKSWDCVEDTSVFLADGTNKEKAMSPANLHATTITDELRLATNFRSRVYGISIKDRGAILPAGHAANAAYWLNEKNGRFTTSTYYDRQFQNPDWLTRFNSRNVADSLIALNWELSYRPSSYIQSTADNTRYEGKLKGEKDPVFPHKIGQLSGGDRYKAIKTLPAGNSLTLSMARACIEGAEGGRLGSGKDVDFLCVSLSSTDYTGHMFAPNSMEAEDMYLKLDKELAAFLAYLDESVGEGNYLLFLTADHGGAHNPEFLKDHRIPAGVWGDATKDMNEYLQKQFKTTSSLVRGVMNYQVFLNESLIAGNKKLSRQQIKSAAEHWLLDVMPAKYAMPVAYVVDMEDMNKTPLPEPIRTMVINGYNRQRSGCLQVILNPGWFESAYSTGTTHGSWNPYDTHIPLLWYGWHIPQGSTHTIVNMTDIAPTLAALLHIQMPSGCIGKPITNLIK